MNRKSSNITLSVLIAVRNEGDYIRNSLRDLLSQHFDYSSVELLVADGCSSDRTEERILQTIDEFPDRTIKLFRNTGILQYSGINGLIGLSTGEYILICDGHTRYPSDFFLANMRALEERDVDIIGGICITEEGQGSFGKAIAACQTTVFGVGNSSFRVFGQSGPADSVPFPCIKRQVFEELGLFRDEQESNADTDFYARAKRAGYSIYLDSRISSTYFARSNLTKLAIQMFRNGRWFPCQLDSVRLRHLAPLFFVLFELGVPIVAMVLSVGSLFIVWCIFNVIYLLSATVSAIRYHRNMLSGADRVKMIICYFTMHFAYGLGWLKGFMASDVRHALRMKNIPPKPLNEKCYSILIPLHNAGRY